MNEESEYSFNGCASFRRRPESSGLLTPLDSGLRRNDEKAASPFFPFFLFSFPFPR